MMLRKINMDQKAFTLIEIVVTVIIVGILTAIMLPNFKNMVNRSYAQDAMRNLMTIYSSQQSYAQDNNALACYPNSTAAACGGSANCCSSLANINSHLGLNIVSNGGTSYSCNSTTCTATNAAFTMVVTLANSVSVQPTARYCNGAAYNPCCSGGTAGANCP